MASSGSRNNGRRVLFSVLTALVFAGCVFLFFKSPPDWKLTLLFSLNLSLVAASVLIGPVIGAAVLIISGLLHVFMVLKAIALKMEIVTVILSFAVSVAAYMMLRRADETEEYRLFAINDEIKELQAVHDQAVIEEKTLRTAAEANRAKLEKYVKLEVIYDGLADHDSFNSKVRYILRNVITVFHKEKSIVLMLVKDNKFIKIEADMEADMMTAEADEESLFLKSFDRWVMDSKRGTIIADMNKEVRFKSDGDASLRSIICVPVMTAGETAGVLRISSDSPGAFNQEDLRFLDLIAEVLGKMIIEGYAIAE